MNWRKFLNINTTSPMASDLQKELSDPIGKKTFQLINDALKRRPLKVSFAPNIIKYIVTETICHGTRSENLIHRLREDFIYADKNDFEESIHAVVNLAQYSFSRTRQQQYAGDWYVWRSCGGRRGDGQTRKSHCDMSDVIINWNDPPSPEELVNETSIGKYHAGEIAGCRCYAEPVIDLDTFSRPMRIYRNGQVEKINKTDFRKIFQRKEMQNTKDNRGDHMKFCKYCNRQVQPKRTINWFALLVMCLITGGLWLFIYVPYYLFFKSPSCPICGAKL